MTINRRHLVASAPAIFTAGTPLLAAASQESVTSGGIGLGTEDVLSIYEELPPGQGFLNVTEPQTGTTLYFSFGEDDLAHSIWVSGELDEETAEFLITWLCPDDIEFQNQFEILTSAGSIATRKSFVIHSPWLAGFDAARSLILASYVVFPGGGAAGGDMVEELMLTVESGNRG